MFEWVTAGVVTAVVFTICYFYQAVYLLAPFLIRRAAKPEGKVAQLRYAVLVPARNEAAVIAQLISSVARQDYPPEKITVFVVADNCSDDTARLAGEAGATVWERRDEKSVGKGHALDFLFAKVFASCGHDRFDGFFVFDADNLLDKNYVAEMNRTFCRGHRVVTSYRNSKNYAANWLSAGSSLWFLRESKYMNHSRMLLGTGCAVSGTGFLVSAEVARANGGWPFHLLTEDIEFSVHCALAGERIAFCPTAVFYDEQPVTFRASWNQRIRWARGFWQVFRRYGAALVKSVPGKNGFYAFDMLMTVLPGMAVTAVGLTLNAAAIVAGTLAGVDVAAVTALFLRALATLYALLFAIGAVTLATEWKLIRCRAFFKVAYLPTFPLFMLTYVPVVLAAMFSRVKWKPIPHAPAESFYAETGKKPLP